VASLRPHDALGEASWRSSRSPARPANGEEVQRLLNSGLQAPAGVELDRAAP
jgi:hypothetical protein